MSHVHAFFMHMYHSFLLLILILFGTCLHVSLSLLFFWIVCTWHPSAKLLRFGILFVLGHLLLLILLLFISSFVIIKPVRTFQGTFLDVAFIWNARSSFWIFLILTYPLSFTVWVESSFVTSQSTVPLWSYRSFTPICVVLITPYLAFSLLFEVYI